MHVWIYVYMYRCVYVCTCIYVGMHIFGMNKRERREGHPDVGWRSAGCVSGSPFRLPVRQQLPHNRACTPRLHDVADAPTSPTSARCAARRWAARSLSGHISSWSTASREPKLPRLARTQSPQPLCVASACALAAGTGGDPSARRSAVPAVAPQVPRRRDDTTIRHPC